MNPDDGLTVDLDSLLEDIGRPCTRLEAGGFRPTGAPEESWLGKVSLFGSDEDPPTNREGAPMHAVAQLFLPSFETVAGQPNGVELLTVFFDGHFNLQVSTASSFASTPTRLRSCTETSMQILRRCDRSHFVRGRHSTIRCGTTAG